jgi:hypothetical protein
LTIRNIGSFVGSLVPPKLAQDVHGLREFIRSDEFANARAQGGDLVAIDRIFTEAKELSWQNTYEALLISFVATMDHRRVGVDLPLLGPLLWFPLTSEFEEEFAARLQALPRMLYLDSPKDEHGDRDKLQHFFGSAFLAYVFESRESAERVGETVELGEAQFIVGGVLDQRDRRANRHGQNFGLALLYNEYAMPSESLMLVTAAGTPETGRRDIEIMICHQLQQEAR